MDAVGDIISIADGTTKTVTCKKRGLSPIYLCMGWIGNSSSYRNAEYSERDDRDVKNDSKVKIINSRTNSTIIEVVENN